MSIESKHRDKLEEIKNNESEIIGIQKKLNVLYSKRLRMSNIQDVFSLLSIDDDIHEFEKKIQELQQSTHNNYLLKVSGILGQYSKTSSDPFTQMASTSSNNTTLCDFVEKRTNNKRGQLFNEYMNIVNEDTTNITYQDITNNQCSQFTCEDCNLVMKLSVNESYLVCGNCGTYESYFEPSVTGLTYEQEINTDTNIHFAYKRINHLRELLAQLQAKESSEIPTDVLNSVRAEFKKARIKDVSEITQEKVKYYLKKLNFNKYYEHTRQITNILNGKPPPCISNELYEKLINMFMEIQEPFERVCPKNRKNFFSYNYILYKFCELLGETEIMTLFPLLKSREKLYQQDCIWKNICSITGYTFYKSV